MVITAGQLANNESVLQAQVAKFRIYPSYAALFPAMIATVVFGSLSDVVGRQKLFLLPCVSMTVKTGHLAGRCVTARELVGLLFGQRSRRSQ